MLENDNLQTQQPEQSKSNKVELIKIAERAKVLAAIALLSISMTACAGDKDPVESIPTETTIATEEEYEQMERELAEAAELAKAVEINNAIIENIVTDENKLVTTEFSGGELVDYKWAPEDLVEGYNFKYLTPEQQSELISMRDMSFQEFYELPREEQFKFSYWILKNYQPRFDYILRNNDIDSEYKDNPESTQDYLDNYAYIHQISDNLKIDNHNNQPPQFDLETSLKMMPLLYIRGYNPNIENGFIEGAIKIDNAKAPALDSFKINILKETKLYNGDYLLNLHFEASKMYTDNGEPDDVQMIARISTFESIDGKTINILSVGDTYDIESSKYIHID
jgi:hypothetical protein